MIMLESVRDPLRPKATPRYRVLWPKASWLLIASTGAYGPDKQWWARVLVRECQKFIAQYGVGKAAQAAREAIV